MACRIAAGCGYGYIYKRFYNGDDTWQFNHDSFIQYQRLVHSPGLFFSDLFSSNPTAAPGLYFQDLDTYMQRLECAVMTKLLAPFNLITQGNYYLNIVFFSFLSFWGAWFLYKLLLEQFFPSPLPSNTRQHSRKFASISLISVAVFLFLPLVFWLSGIRGDGLLLLFTGVLLYYFAQVLTRPRLVNITVCITSFALAAVIRGGFALSLLPALVAWALCARLRVNPLRAFGSIYILLAILFWGSSFLPSPYNPMHAVVQRQQSFFSLHGNTRFNLTPLQSNAGSFISVAPEALVNTLLRPWPWEAKGALQWLVALENILIWALIILCLTRYRKETMRLFNHPLSWVLLLTALCNYLLIGYVVPFPGAIVRYRAIPELFLLCLLAVAIDNANQPITAERQI